MKRPALFLDRDGVLVEDPGYLSHPDQIRPIPGSFAAVARACAAGFVVVIVTNQSGIGRGYYTEADFRCVQSAIEALAAAEGAHFDGVYHCPAVDPAHPDRKPNPGMLTRAIRDLDLDPSRSLMVGDKLRDLEAAVRADILHVCLVRTGEGAEEQHVVRAEQVHPAEYWVCDDLAAAVSRWLER